MHQTIKQQWTEALRSRTYAQCKDHLRNGTFFCVLGVLCDLHSQASGTPWQGDCGVHTYYGHDKWPSFHVREWAEVQEQSCERLYQLNDSGGKTFPELADWIDVNL